MFNPIIATIKDVAPSFAGLFDRYVSAKEQEAHALTMLANEAHIFNYERNTQHGK